jgi:hypothetical protein
MSVEYMFPNGRSMHYDAFLDTISEINGTDREKIECIDKDLAAFKGKIISVNGWGRHSVGILGIEFETEEDLLYFKLKFN